MRAHGAEMSWTAPDVFPATLETAEEAAAAAVLMAAVALGRRRRVTERDKKLSTIQQLRDETRRDETSEDWLTHAEVAEAPAEAPDRDRDDPVAEAIEAPDDMTEEAEVTIEEADPRVAAGMLTIPLPIWEDAKGEEVSDSPGWRGRGRETKGRRTTDGGESLTVRGSGSKGRSRRRHGLSDGPRLAGASVRPGLLARDVRRWKERRWVTALSRTKARRKGKEERKKKTNKMEVDPSGWR
jgi:hypothetical protein